MSCSTGPPAEEPALSPWSVSNWVIRLLDRDRGATAAGDDGQDAAIVVVGLLQKERVSPAV